ncbi:MAG TPA: zinc-binding dehydrogenase [Xanthomonadales bacterium]|nr:zinc-binding dehydrogenase [Xanthomonadales bacterium]
MKENRKIIIHQLGESFRDCTSIVPEPCLEPAAGEVRVRHHYAGVNGVYDQMMCLDRVEHTRVTPPADTGVEAVGMIDKLGPGVNDFCIGDPVAVVKAGSGYRLGQVCSTDDLISIPQCSPEILALVPSGVSALLALEQVGELSRGEVICITAAAGGLGNVAVQLALGAGNHVIAVCGSDEKAEWLRKIGINRVIQYRRENMADVIGSEYRDRLDLVLDSVGGETFDVLLENLAPHGRLVVCGYTSDRLPTARVSNERVYTRLYWKAASVRGFMNYRFAKHAPEARERLFNMLSSGRLTPLVDGRQFTGLEQVADAVEHLLAGQNLGKVVVDLRD